MPKTKIILLISLFISCNIFCQINIACVGNSITSGYGLSSTESYPVRLQNLLGSNYVVSNYGVSGRTMLKNGTKPYWVETAYSNALSSNPNIVIIMLGTNDSQPENNWNAYGDEFYDDYVDMVNSFKTLEAYPEIYICLVPPAYSNEWTISETIIANEINPTIKQIAINLGVNLIDMHTRLSDKEYMFDADGIHPNATGALEIATCVYEVLTTSKPNIAQNNNSLSAPESNSYQWYLNETPVNEANGGKNQVLNNPETGNYKVGIQPNADNENFLISNSLSYDNTLTVKTKNFNDYYIYPNPSKNFFYLNSEKLNTEKLEIGLYALNGKEIYAATNLTSNKINVEKLTPGVYMYTIKNIDTKKVYSGKLVIEK